MTDVITLFQDVVVNGMALVGVFTSLILLMELVWLKDYLWVPLMVKLRGGRVGRLFRGVRSKLVYLAPSDKKYMVKNQDGTEEEWVLPRKNERLSSGDILETCLVEGVPFSFSPDQVLDLAEQMANSHLENLKTFMVPSPQDPQGPKIPAIDPQLWPNSPRYVIPELLSSRLLAEQIKSEASARAEITKDKDSKPFYTTMLIGGGIFILVAIIIVVKFGFDYKMCEASAQAVVSTINTTTTLLNQGVSSVPTSLPGSMV